MALIRLLIVLFFLGNSFAQGQDQLNLKKLELLKYVREKVQPQLNLALETAEESQSNRWLLFGGGALTVGGFIVVQHQKVLQSLSQKIRMLLADQDRLNLQIQQQTRNGLNAVNEMRLARTQARSNIILGSVFDPEGVTVAPYNQLDNLTDQISHIDQRRLNEWWDLLRNQRGLNTQINIQTRANVTVSTAELDELVVKIANLENEIFANGQRQIAIEIQKIKADSIRLQQLLKDAKANISDATVRVNAISNNVQNLRSNIKAHNARYLRIGGTAIVGLAGLGFVANMFWVNERYKDYFGQTLSEQRISSSSSYTQKQNTIYLMAKNHIMQSYEGCPEQDYEWIHQSLREEESVEHVNTWIEAMQAVCLKLSLMDEESCITSES